MWPRIEDPGRRQSNQNNRAQRVRKLQVTWPISSFRLHLETLPPKNMSAFGPHSYSSPITPGNANERSRNTLASPQTNIHGLSTGGHAHGNMNYPYSTNATSSTFGIMNSMSLWLRQDISTSLAAHFFVLDVLFERSTTFDAAWYVLFSRWLKV